MDFPAARCASLLVTNKQQANKYIYCILSDERMNDWHSTDTLMTAVKPETARKQIHVVVTHADVFARGGRPFFELLCHWK